MNRKLIPITLILMLAFTNSALSDDFAGKTVGYYMKNQTAPEWNNWIEGVGIGFWVANRELTNSKQAPLFCFSGPYTPEAKPMLDAWIAKEHTKGMIQPGEYFGDALSVEVALLIAYENAFPCTHVRKAAPPAPIRR